MSVEPPLTEEQILTDIRERQEKSWPSSVPKEIAYDLGEVPLTDYLRMRAKRNPDDAVIVFYGYEMTFAELDRLSDQVAAYLLDRGVGRGDRVAVMMQNCPQFIVAFYGILKAGAVHVPVNPMFQEAELIYELEDSGAEIIFVFDSLAGLVERVIDRSPLHQVVTTSVSEYVPAEPTIPLPHGFSDEHPALAHADTWADVLAAKLPEEWPEVGLDDLAALNYTGGTTGMPKGCEHTQRHMLYTAAVTKSSRFFGMSTDNLVMLSFLPVFWIAGENTGVIYPIYAGVPCVLLTRWDPVAVMTGVDRYKANVTVGTVDNYIELIDHPDFHKYDLKSITLPAAMSFVTKLGPEFRARWRKLVGEQSVLREGSYGMTETHTNDSFIGGFQDDDYDLHARPVFCGLPMPETAFKICDFDTGEVLPVGSEGEICVKTPSLLTRYWNKPAATDAALRNGWLHTGDIGQIGEDGCLHFLGRSKEMLKVNGMSVFPSELEVLLSKHPDIEATAVIGIPDPKRGESPLAFVVISKNAKSSPDPESLRAWCKENMATYKVPQIQIVDEMPLTATGKIKKHVLTERFNESVAAAYGADRL